tara:strand:+ start:6 stop:404 length:399 start_codon:yes stop_codon:yes gene_type:complete
MKKLLGILVLGLLCCENVFARISIFSEDAGDLGDSGGWFGLIVMSLIFGAFYFYEEYKEKWARENPHKAWVKEATSMYGKKNVEKILRSSERANRKLEKEKKIYNEKRRKIYHEKKRKKILNQKRADDLFKD